MSDWDAALYRQFEQERTRPAADLLDGVGPCEPQTIVDLGCGPGNSTALLVNRFPGAAVTGVDLSPGMLEQARERLPGCRFEAADICTWAPPAPCDLIFANAALQWVPDHATLLPRLLGSLSPGGILAVQMPDNRDEPSHAAMRAVAAERPWADLMPEGAATRIRILGGTAYYDLLAPLCASLEVWRTTYHHPMRSAAAIVDWVRATGLRPFLDALPADDRAGFTTRYQELIDRAYPPRADGRRLLAFPRLFLVARRAP